MQVESNLTDTKTNEEKPFKNNKLSKWKIVITTLLVIALFIVATVIFVAFQGFEYDDCYIFFRYMDKFASGHGFVFNDGEKCEGFSSFTWVILIGSIKFLTGGNTVYLAKVVGFGAYIFAVIVACTSVFFSIRKLHAGEFSRLLTVIGVALFSVLVPSGTLWAISGLENGLYALTLVIYVILVADNSRPLLAGLAAVLVAATRVEGLIFCVLPVGVGLVEIVYHGRFRGFTWSSIKRYFLVERRGYYLGFYLVFVGYFLAVTIFRLYYFGDYLPATAHFKAPTSILSNISAGWQYLLSFIRANIAYSILFALAILLFKFWWRNCIAVCCIIVLFIQIFFSVWVGGDWMGYNRFFSSFIPLSAIIISVAGVHIFIRGFYTRILVCIVAVGMIFMAARDSRALYLEASNCNGMGKVLKDTNIKLGNFLNEHTPPDGVIAVGDAGAIPYFAKRNVIDLHGLLDKHLSAYVGNFTNAPHSDVDVDYLMERKPSWFVIIANGLRGTPGGAKGVYALYDKILQDSRFEKDYEFFAEFPLASWYVYHIYFDKQQLMKLSWSFLIEESGVGQDSVEVYLNNSGYPLVVRPYMRGSRQFIDGQTVFANNGEPIQLRFDFGSVDNQLIDIYDMEIISGSLSKRDLDIFRDFQVYNAKTIAITPDKFTIQTTSSDPILIFPITK